ncbi:MAG: hypothetical protein JWQ09_5656 [Segetibacter sp.]|nr:hypothetical protein [Segetibacter sp.]
METKERIKRAEYSDKQNKIVKKKYVSNQDKPKMYQKAREILSFVNSDLSKDIIEHREE